MTNKLNSYTTVYQIKKEKPNWNQVSPENISVKTVWRQQDRLKLYNGMLYREWIDVTGIKTKQKTKKTRMWVGYVKYVYSFYLSYKSEY